MARSTLGRHYTREFFGAFAIIGLGLAMVINILGAVRRMDRMSDDGASAILKFIALSYPKNFLNFLPIASLLCSLYVVSMASRSRELVAVSAAGGRLKALFLPLVLSGALLSATYFAVGELVVPACSTMLGEEFYKDEALVSMKTKGGTTWIIGSDGSVVKMDLFMDSGFLGHTTIFRTEGGRMSEVLEAASGQYVDGQWVLKGVDIYKPSQGTMKHSDKYLYPHLGSPSQISHKLVSPFDLGLLELGRYIERMHAAGFRNTELEIGYHSRISGTLVPLIMVVLGLSLASRKNITGIISATLALGVSALYWMASTLAQSLGFAGLVPPMVAAWMSPVLFGAVALYLYREIPE